jgi:uroporphyrinogen-III synthase
MPSNRISILSTRPLPASLLDEARSQSIHVDVLSFIETEAIRTVEVQQEIEQAFAQSSTVVFTSMNAVEAVAEELHGEQPDWRIYSIGNTTRQLVQKYFGDDALAGFANSATELAELMVEEEVGDEVIFFCGDQRRDELPAILREHEIEVQEIVVYETIAVPHRVNKPYQGILFFSPSAVDSFFSVNRLNEQVILFAIGNTTASALKKYSKNRVIVSGEPGKENLFRTMLDFFDQ